MNYDPNCVNLIMELSDAFGPSGFEDEVLTVARRYVDGIGRIEEDCLRNLYIHRKENTGDKPVLMLDAHSDEVGFMVQAVRPDGTLRIVKIGGWNERGLVSADVLVRNGRGEYLPGIIAAKPPHFMTAAEKASSGVPAVSSLSVDIGASSAQEAIEDFGIAIGEPIVPATKCRFDEKHGLFFGKAFDCRIGVAALLETMRRLEGLDLPCDVVGVLSSQEELGERGCRVAVNHVKPQIAYAFEGCPADDTFCEPYLIQTALRKGPMLRYMDVSVICSPRYQRHVLTLAKENGIKAQGSVREGGGNDGAVINLACEGIPVVVAGVPSRYVHSMNCITTYEDFESSVQLAVANAKSVTPELIAPF